MTENEAIEELKYDCNELGKAIPCDTGWGVTINSAYDMAIKALEEIQQYRAIGTVEECQEATEKQKAKKYERGLDNDVRCPVCGTYTTDIFEHRFCTYCGQRLE